MSSAQVRCPECSSVLRVSASLDPSAMIRCPKCKDTFQRSDAGKVTAAPKPTSPRTGVKASDRSEPRASAPSPRKRRSDEDSDPDIRPRKKSKQTGPSPVLIWSLAGGGLLALAALGLFFLLRSGDKPSTNQVAQNPPLGPGGPGIPPGGALPPRVTGLPGGNNPGTPPPGQPPIQPPPVQPPIGQPRDPDPKDPPNEDAGPIEAPPALPEAKDRPYLTLDPGGHSAMVKGALFTPDSKRLITASADKTVRVHDVRSGETIHIFHLPVGPSDEGSLMSAAVSRDGRRLAVSGMPVARGAQGFPIYLLRLDTGRLERVIMGNTNLVVDLNFSPDGRWLASSCNDGSVQIFDPSTGKPLLMLPKHPDRVRCVVFSPNGQYLATGCGDKIIRLFALLPRLNLVAEMKGHGAHVISLAFSPDGRTLVSGSSDDGLLRVWNLNGKQRAAHLIKDREGGPLQLTSLNFTRDSKEVLFTGIAFEGMAGLIDVATGQQRIVFRDHSNTVVCGHLSPDGQLAVSSGGNDNETFIWRTADGGVVHKLVGKGKAVCATAWSPDGKSIAWGNTNRGDPTRGTMPLERTFRLDTLDFGPVPDASYLRKMRESGGYTMEAVDFYSIAVKHNGTPIGVHKSREKDRIYSFSPMPDGKHAIIGASYSLYMIDLASGRVVRDYHGHSGIVFSVSPAPNGKYFLTGSTDQTMCVFHVDRAEPLLSLFVAGRDWIAWTPEGYYTASAYGERLMGWLLNNGLDKLASYFPAIRFRASLFQPEAMRRILRAGSVQRALLLAARDRNRPAQQSTHLGNVLPPDVRITSPGDGELKQARVEVKAVARATGNHAVRSMRLIVDGRPWKGMSEVRTFDNAPGEVEASWQVELPPGQHSLVVLADSAVSRGSSAPVSVMSSGEGAELPNLYVLAMGISAYPGKLRLHYAAADADAIAQAFREKTGGIFKSVNVRQVKDRDATRQGILDGLRWLQGVMTQKDVAVISFSGHGARDDEGNFYLVPVDVNPRDPRSLLDGEVLKEALANLPGKVVCMLDACHSGSVAEDGPVVKPGSPDQLIRDLVNDEYGVIVMCSSMGSEYSLESTETKQGFFTLGIVEGLSGRADLNRDSVVYIHELDFYAGRRVQQLSGGRQNPTLGKPPGIRTFPLAKP